MTMTPEQLLRLHRHAWAHILERYAWQASVEGVRLGPPLMFAYYATAERYEAAAVYVREIADDAVVNAAGRVTRVVYEG